MARIVVQEWEHERGWGVRPDGKTYFPLTDQGWKDAKALADRINGENTLPVVPDHYWTASESFIEDKEYKGKYED